MYWPDRDFVLPEPSNSTTLWVGGPKYNVFFQILRPALKALFLQGYRVRRICTCAGGKNNQPAYWLVFDRETLEITEVLQIHTPLQTGLDVVFDVSPVFDQWGPAAEGYGMANTPVRLGFDGALPTNGSVPSALSQSINAFVDTAITRLREQAAQGNVVRANHQGLLWIFNPQYFQGLEGFSLVPADLVYQHIITSATVVLPDLIYDRRRKATLPHPLHNKYPNFSRLSDETYAGVIFFWDAIRRSLRHRGEDHRLTMTMKETLSGLDSEVSWLDGILKLLGLGVIKMDGLIEPCDPPDPVVATVVPAGNNQPERLILNVWNETKITIFREINTRSPTAAGGYNTGLDGSVSWEYVANPGEKPRLVIVASRGIKIEAPTYRKGLCPWELDIYRVQQESLVPPNGGTIHTNLFMSSGPVSPREGEILAQAVNLVIARPKKDGLLLDFPASTPDQYRFKVNLTLTDPCSGKDGYTVDAHYYSYEVAEGVDPSGYRTGVHLCIWATAGVKLEASGATLVIGSQYVTSYAGQAINYKASAEAWLVPELKDIPYPFSTVQGLTPSMTVNSSLIHAQVERFQNEQAHFLAADNRQINLTENTFYVPADSGIYDVMDIAIGLIPFVGDWVDLGELARAWSSGRDKWGRPVTNFDLAMMTIFTGVPFVTNAYYLGLKSALLDGGGIIFQSNELQWLLSQARRGIFNDADARKALDHSPAWRYFLGPEQDPQRAQAVNGLIDFARGNANLIEDLGTEMFEHAGETWLSLDDIFDRWNLSFRSSILDTGFQRWIGNGNPPDPLAYLQQLPPTSVERALAETLLASTTPGRSRFVPQRVHCPSDADRFPIGGAIQHVLATNLASFDQSVRDFVEVALSDASRLRIVQAGFLSSVKDLAGDKGFVLSAIQALLARFDPADLHSIKKIIGNDVIAGIQMSTRERAARFGNALFAAAAELRANNLDPSILLQPELLPELQKFVCGFINRTSEIGARFELSKSTSFYLNLIQNRYDAVVEFGTQVPLPPRDWYGIPGIKVALKGPDIVLILQHQASRFACFFQLKAYHDLARLASNRVGFVFDDASGLPVDVIGSEYARQGISDLVRAAHLNFQVPSPRLIRGSSYLPEEIDEWNSLLNVHVFMFDAALARNHLIQLAWDARVRTNAMLIQAGDLQADAITLQTFEGVFPNGLDLNLPENEFLAFVDNRIGAWALEVQNGLNENVMSTLDEAFGLPFRFLVVPSTVSEREVVDQVLAMQNALEEQLD